MATDLRERVLNELHRIEPRLLAYAAIAPSGTVDVCEAVFHSQEDERVRANALYLTCALDQERGLKLAGAAIAMPESRLRIAAIRCLEQVETEMLSKATPVIELGLSDPYHGVRKFALRLIETRKITALSSQVLELENSDSYPHLRAIAKSIASRN